MSEDFDGPGEDDNPMLSVMRADRSIDRSGTTYQVFTVYAFIMLVVYPIGVPCLYAVIFHRSRNELLELRRIELDQETNYALAKLRAQAADSAEEAEVILRQAEQEHDAAVAAYQTLRDELPTTLRKLTAGCKSALI